MAESVVNDLDEYVFKIPEDIDFNMYIAFLSRYMGILEKRARRWEEIEEEDLYTRNTKMKRFVRKGIPENLRKKMWMFFSGAVNYQNEIDCKYTTEGHEKFLIAKVILLNIRSTFPNNIYINTEGALQQQLHNILVAFTLQNPEVHHCQRLTYIAGLLLFTTKDEEASFWLLKTLVEKILPPYYTLSMSALVVDIIVLNELIAKMEPEIYRHICDIGMPVAATTTKWFICLYAEVLPTKTVQRIWDCLFYEGSKILFLVALTLIRMHKKQILKTKELEELVTCFKEMRRHPNVVDCHAFMANVFKISLPMETIEALRKEQQALYS